MEIVCLKAMDREVIEEMNAQGLQPNEVTMQMPDASK